MIKPTIEQIHEYLLTRNVDDYTFAEFFFVKQEEREWMRGKKGEIPIKNWKKTVNVWLVNRKKYDKPQKQGDAFDRLTDRSWATDLI